MSHVMCIDYLPLYWGTSKIRLNGMDWEMIQTIDCYLYQEALCACIYVLESICKYGGIIMCMNEQTVMTMFFLCSDAAQV